MNKHHITLYGREIELCSQLYKSFVHDDIIYDSYPGTSYFYCSDDELESIQQTLVLYQKHIFNLLGNENILDITKLHRLKVLLPRIHNEFLTKEISKPQPVSYLSKIYNYIGSYL